MSGIACPGLGDRCRDCEDECPHVDGYTHHVNHPLLSERAACGCYQGSQVVTVWADLTTCPRCREVLARATMRPAGFTWPVYVYETVGTCD